MPKEMKFHGILAVGRTKTDAINNYRLLALSKGATVQVDSERSISFVTQASGADGLFNPASGNMDLETDDSLMEQLDFQSNSSAEVEVNHLVCENGCGAHVVFDSEELVKYCPHCTSSLSEAGDDDEDSDDEDLDDEDSDDEDSDDLESDSFDIESDSDDLESDSFDFESDSADEEESEDDEESTEDSEDEEESEGDEEPKEDKTKSETKEPEERLPELTEDDGSVVIGDGIVGDGIVVAADSYEQAVDLFRANVPMSALASDATTIDVEYVVCSSSECGAHVVSTDEITLCPVCQSSVVEPDENTLSLVDDDGELSPDTDEESDEESDDSDSEESSVTTDESDDSESEESESADLTMQTVHIDLARSLSTDDVAKLDVSYSSSIAGQSRWTAFVEGTPVAMASKSSVGNNADIFDSPSFGHAVLATAKISGIRTALSELGFETIKPSVSIAAEVKHLVESEVAEARSQLEKQQSEFKERFAAALATAAVGLNRGFYADKKNPIKAALWSAMSSAGIRNPESMIDAVFKNHSDAYHKTLFDAASELISQPLEAQESISKAISGMSYSEVSASSDDLEHRLETFGTSVSSGTPASADAPKPADGGLGRQAISQAVQSLGRRGR